MYELLMERVMNSKLFLLLTLSGLICSVTHAATQAISVNYVKVLGTNEEISSFGIDSEGGDFSGWINTINGSIPNATLDDGRATAINVTSVRPAGQQSGSNTDTAYDGSPLNAYVIAGTPAGKEAHATIDNLNEVFPNGYKIIVYLNGHRMVQNACIYLTEEGGPDDWNSSTDTFYRFTTEWNVGSYSGTPAITDTQDQVLNQNGTKLVAVTNAQYAVFDSLTADRVTLTLDTVKSSGGGAGLSGFQIIGDF